MRSSARTRTRPIARASADREDALAAGQCESPERYLAPYGRVVVVSPHPDDDVIGCGGTIAAAAALGLAVEVAYVTDGSASHAGSREYPATRLAAVREDEACAALEILGATAPPHFFRWPDGAVPGPDEAAAMDLLAGLAALACESDEATLMLVPWRRDPHPDHRAVAALARRSFAGLSHVTTAEYVVWLDERGEAEDRAHEDEAEVHEVDVDAFVDRKRAALAEHRSQLGELIHDAREAFVLPRGLLDAAARPVERFFHGR